jgi:anthranilate synthase component II
MVLLIDNYDSFTYNLAHRLGELGAAVKVVRNDAMSLADIERLAPERIVISPGPGRPESAGMSVEVLQRFAERVPILGVCLGHQALAVAFGGRVVRASAPMHGKTSLVAHEASHLFAGLTEPFEAGRYHSLVVERDAVPPGFVVSAWVVSDRTIMGLRHESRPIYGVQFHPESVLTPVGQRLLQNFLDASAGGDGAATAGRRRGASLPGQDDRG